MRNGRSQGDQPHGEIGKAMIIRVAIGTFVVLAVGLAILVSIPLILGLWETAVELWREKEKPCD